MVFLILILILVAFIILIVAIVKISETSTDDEEITSVIHKTRKEYYQEYLKSEAWQRKRFVVMRRDNWQCVYCGAKATQVHHRRYLYHNLGKEPIDWLVSVCVPCHERQHQINPPTYQRSWGRTAQNINWLFRRRRRRWWR
jgi:5-methylcytosine-specific restriction endonuclease McrA